MSESVSGSAGDEFVIRPARPRDLPAVLALLEESGLPSAGVAEGTVELVVSVRGGRVIGVAGLEVYGSEGLLRSVAVEPAWRGHGAARALTSEMLAVAKRRGIGTIYLLTETAEEYFLRLGFRRIAREEAAESVRGSAEFREICPSSAVVMVMTLESSPGALQAGLPGRTMR